MVKLTAEQQEQYLDVLRRHEEALLRYEGVTEVGIGYPWKGGQVDDGRISIIVFVVKKHDQDELTSEQLLPKEIEGIPVDVVESDPREHAEDWRNPLVGGSGISNVHLNGRGTLGAIVKDRKTGRLLGLTNWHVIKRKWGKAGHSIVQPAWKPNNAKYRIGKLLRWHKALDAAVFEVHVEGREAIPFTLLDIAGPVTSMTQPLMGMEVMKSGARTGVTYGRVSVVKKQGISVKILPRLADDKPGVEISQAGDSGSLWITVEAPHQAVALHWGGDPGKSTKTEYALARSIKPIADALDFDFESPVA